MRRLNKFAKVEGHNSLVRDLSSHAIVSTNDAEFKAYQTRREIEKKRVQDAEKTVQEIENIKNDMLEIKQMLSQLISTKGH
jgi:hypothetical protein